MEGVWNAPRVRAARSFFFASALWAQADRLKRMVCPALIADKLAYLEWNAKEAQRLASNGDSHGTCCIVRALAGRTQHEVALPICKKDGTLTRGLCWGLRETRTRPKQSSRRARVLLGSRVWIPSYLSQ